MSEATALPTVQQPLPRSQYFLGKKEKDSPHFSTGQISRREGEPPPINNFLSIKNEPTPASFSIIFGLYKQTIYFLQ